MNSGNSPESLHHLMINQSGKLAKIQQKSAQLQHINHFLTSELIPGSGEYCQVANIRQGKLIIEVASGVWKTRLMQLSQSILEQMQQHISPTLFAIELKVNPVLFNQETNKNTPNQRRISQETAEHLMALAQNAPPKVAESLRRLANLAKRP